jgi:two-component system, OmpR family, response regulator
MKRINTPQCANHLVEKLSSFLSDGETSDLNDKQLYGVMLASAFATNNKSFINDILNIASDYVDEVTINTAKSAASLSNMDFKQSGIPSLESEIIIENPDKEFIRAFHTPYTQVYESNNNQINDLEFQLYLLAASFVSDFDRYIEIREQLIDRNIFSGKIITSVIHIAATTHSISELVVSDLDRKKRVLVVDDEVRMTRMLKLTLERTGGFTVRTENKGANALNAARAFKPDLILLDVIMPDIGGEDVAAKIKEDEELCDIKIVFLTALLTKDETGNTGKKIGRFLFLAKPIRDDDLIHCIEKQINNSVSTVSL